MCSVSNICRILMHVAIVNTVNRVTNELQKSDRSKRMTVLKDSLKEEVADKAFV